MNLLDLVFPRHCLGCGRIGRYFCSRCSRTIRVIEPNEAICPVCERLAIDGATHPRCQSRYSLDGLTSFFRYEGIVRQAVKAIKYRYVSDLTQEFIDLIPTFSFPPTTYNVQPLDSPSTPLRAGARGRPTTLIPIPLHPSRLRFRGFNQAEVLGKLVARRLNIPMRTDILKRVKKTTPQVEMKDREKRLKNTEKVFAVPSNILVSQYPSVFLFDDVFTTGATLRSAANVLKRGGAMFVWGITMAR